MTTIKKTTISTTYRRNDLYHYRFSWIKLARPMTFTGTICPMLVGTGLAAEKGHIQFDIFITLLIATLFIQAATNMLNDYFDFKHGQDKEKWVLAEGQSSLHRPAHHLIPFVASTLITIAIILGIWLSAQTSFWIILVGTLGILFGYFYSAGPRPLCSVGLGELVAACFLGLATTILAYVVQGNLVNSQILTVSITFALLIASMILTNNIRDIEKDRSFRHTLGILLGRKKAVILLKSLLILSYLWVFGAILSGIVSWTSSVVLFAFPLAMKLRWSFRLGAKRNEEREGMKWAAWHHWAFGLLFACGIWLMV
ncbi:prenyltransferase [Lentibacillus sp. Marseille-P4043]|uniref:prenyltransferase n=1 Tax=Lentibacillus sp. Marseille-P4043 TaxID=2040293 RepID=UPI000D0B0EFB|nr:prenyltransferase [Lentibacillus sp. Marseille-P4043]